LSELAPLVRLALLPAALALGGVAAGADPAWGAAGEEAPPQPGISDNSFFIEEAYNQEAGVVQHIQTVLGGFDREGGDRTRSLGYTFTQEWPLGGVRHQISYTLPYERLGGDQPSVRGVGDVFLNYRYQVWMEEGRRPAFAPRFSVIFPSGDEDEGLGTGTIGYQVNFPLSKKIGDSLHLHLNAGATRTPGARRDLPSGGRSPATDLVSAHVGFSTILLLRPRFNVLMEFLTASEASIDDAGERERATRTLFSPGARYAINTRGGAQWVLGAAAPFGLSAAEDDWGVLLYLSFEHPFTDSARP
jgi:hypothetical protein